MIAVLYLTSPDGKPKLSLAMKIAAQHPRCKLGEIDRGDDQPYGRK